MVLRKIVFQAHIIALPFTEVIDFTWVQCKKKQVCGPMLGLQYIVESIRVVLETIIAQ